MTIEEWQIFIEKHGVSSDTVNAILRDWKEEVLDLKTRIEYMKYEYE